MFLPCHSPVGLPALRRYRPRPRLCRLLAGTALLLRPLPLGAEAAPLGQALAETSEEAFRLAPHRTADQEAALGSALALQAFAELGRLTTDHTLRTYVALVGQALVAVSHRPQATYYFAVCEHPEPYLLSVPGGYVFLTTGLLKLLRNEEELAGVLSHALAHSNLPYTAPAERPAPFRHPFAELEAFSKTMDSLLGRPGPPSAAPPAPQPPPTAASVEVAADAYALRLSDRAGYRVQALPEFLAALATLQEPRYGCLNCRPHQSLAARQQALQQLCRDQEYPELPAPPARTARFQTLLSEHLP